uniref:F-box associated domain-containing protein n=1 Tax=Leersia perrieri TaxID=77586 RepID=A0A0D9XZH2_9ORYZ
MAEAKLAGHRCQLTVVGGRLGVTMATGLTVVNPDAPSAEVWVLEDGRDEQRWMKRYTVQGLHWHDQWIARPYCSHDKGIIINRWWYSHVTVDAHQSQQLDNGICLVKLDNPTEMYRETYTAGISSIQVQ